MRKLPYVLLFAIWFLLGAVEMIAPYIIDKKIFFWRTWEYVSHDDITIPFIPLQHAAFISNGDLAHPLYFEPKPDEMHSLEFVTDEYGFRNYPFLSKKPVEVMVIGTSQVAGASETQNKLVASILIHKYHIPSYTYAKASIQQFSEDTRFRKQPPKYTVILGQDFEFTCNNSYIDKVTDDTVNFSMTAWTKQSWYDVHTSKEDKPLHKDYVHTVEYVKRYSLLRVVSDSIFRHVVNALFKRPALVDIFGTGGYEYDQKNNSIFVTDEGQADPTLGTVCKTKKDIEQTLTTLKTTKAILKKRGITLIVGVMPTKQYLYSPKYKNIPINKTDINYLDQAIDNAGIIRIPLFETIYSKAHATHQIFFYPQDTHWNADTNAVIADLIQERIKEVSKTSEN